MSDEWKKLAKLALPESPVLKQLKQWESLTTLSLPGDALNKTIEASRSHFLESKAFQEALTQSAALASPLEEISRKVLEFALRYDELVPTHNAVLQKYLVTDAKQIEQSQKLFEELTRIRPSLGPLNDVRDLLDRYQVRIDIDNSKWRELLEASENAFRLPELSEHARFAAVAMESSSLVDIDRNQRLITAMGEIRTPWAAVGAEFKSTQAFDRLLDIGTLAGSPHAFNDATSAKLREALGDWRDVGFPDRIEDSLELRASWYESLGLDGGLTTLPTPAFYREVELAELDTGAPVPIAIYDVTIPAEHEEQEHEFQRTKRAYDRLQRFETHLRAYIDRVMTERFGTKWYVQRLDGATRERWEDKRRKAEVRDVAIHPLIAYADFTDYEKLLLRTDNWNEIFKAVFIRQDSLRESLARLYPVRVCTMHSRSISQDDELYLFVETKRILKSIGVL